MYYIIFDLEFNQDFTSIQDFNRKGTRYPFEIIQIGAIKLDKEFNTIDTFDHYVKPTIYSEISPFVTELTGITTDQLHAEEPFSKIYDSFLEFIGGLDSVFCIWGTSDIKELFRNAEYHELNNMLLPKNYINLQPYVSKHLNLPAKDLLRLKHAVEALGLRLSFPFHNAFHDAYYTSEIFKKIYNSSIHPLLYDTANTTIRPIQRKGKRVIDIDKLLQQFEKMYTRQITEEEQEMIKLAYKMGRTNQFLK